MKAAEKRVENLKTLNRVQVNLNRISEHTFEGNKLDYDRARAEVVRAFEYMATDKVKLKGQKAILQRSLMRYRTDGNDSFLVNTLNWMLVGLKIELKIPQDPDLVRWYLA